MEDRKYSQSGQNQSQPTTFPRTESVESSRLDTDKGTDALARSIGNSDEPSWPTHPMPRPRSWSCSSPA